MYIHLKCYCHCNFRLFKTKNKKLLKTAIYLNLNNIATQKGATFLSVSIGIAALAAKNADSCS